MSQSLDLLVENVLINISKYWLDSIKCGVAYYKFNVACEDHTFFLYWHWKVFI